MKVANSITRHAVPSGLFGEQGGKSKQLYDYLYSQTRGAVVPRRSVRVSKDKLMKGADIGSEVTLRSNLKRLRDAGLIKETVVPGAHGGNEYEVFLPEEVGLTPSTPSTPSSPSYPLSNLEGVEPLDSRGSRGGLSLDGSIVSRSPKTSFKDVRRNTDDDEAFADFVLAVKQATREVTGREASVSDRVRWAELAEVLITELKIAAGRTTISSVPAFLAEHLRRRLWKKEKRQLEAEVADSPASTTTRRLDASECPDCFGAGMWYPEGYEKGVARCRHEKLKPEEVE